jgi:drug/metabolite transporter (DMT)-like permease
MRKGILYILIAEFTFAGSSVFAKYALEDSDISGLQVTFFRFLIGALVSTVVMVRRGESFVPVSPQMTAWRAIFNTISAMLFFYSLKYTTVTNANMLGMTYPLWVVLFAPIFLDEKFEWKNVGFVILAIAGVYLVVHPDFGTFNYGDICAFGAGITSSIAILALRQARKFDSTYLIIFYLMTFGLVVNSLMVYPVWVNPSFEKWVLIIVAAFLGFIAQLFITQGYRFIDATRGSLVSSSRILMASAMGIMFFSDHFTLQLVAGAVLILASQYGMILSKLKIKRTGINPS